MESIEQDGRPTGRLEPPDAQLQSIRQQIADGEFKAAIDAVDEYEPSATYHSDWAEYLRGHALFGLEYFDAGYSAFQAPYETTKGLVSDEAAGRRFRLAARALKKLGWLHRRNEEFHQAYGMHSIAFQYLLEYGSYRELHEATISLDVDSYFLKNANLSRMWLERSIEAARLIDDAVVRFKALGMSWNNLAGTLCELKSFEEAEEAIESSLDYWGQYEERTEEKEHRRVWAQYGVGDIYQRWGEYLDSADDEKAREKLAAAEDALSSAVELAKENDMTTGSRKPIERKLERLRGNLEDD